MGAGVGLALLSWHGVGFGGGVLDVKVGSGGEFGVFVLWGGVGNDARVGTALWLAARAWARPMAGLLLSVVSGGGSGVVGGPGTEGGGNVTSALSLVSIRPMTVGPCFSMCVGGLGLAGRSVGQSGTAGWPWAVPRCCRVNIVSRGVGPTGVFTNLATAGVLVPDCIICRLLDCSALGSWCSSSGTWWWRWWCTASSWSSPSKRCSWGSSGKAG